MPYDFNNLLQYNVYLDKKGLLVIGDSANRPYSYTQYWTGTSLQRRLMSWNIVEKEINVHVMYIAFEKTPCISLISCKIGPVQYSYTENINRVYSLTIS